MELNIFVENKHNNHTSRLQAAYNMLYDNSLIEAEWRIYASIN